MKRKCDKCDRPATHHSVEVIKGDKIAKNLCDLHAAEEGLVAAGSHTPVSELLSNFVKQQSQTGTQRERRAANDLTCESCGLTFSQFRETSLLGCGHCYKAFEGPLGPLMERAHEGGTHHVGKIPRRSGQSESRQLQLMRMRKRLDEAVETEDYELAARLRDDITELEESER